MKKVLLLLISCLFISWNAQAQVGSPAVAGIELSHDTIIMRVDAMNPDTTLVATFTPHDAANKDVEWETFPLSSPLIDINYASKDTICTVTIKSIPGDVKVLVKTDESEFTDTCVIRIVVPADGISLDETNIIMVVDYRKTITATLSSLTPFAITEDSIIWENLNPEFIEIETNGDVCNILGINKGIAKVVAKTYDYDGVNDLFEEHTDTCIINIVFDPIENLRLSEQSLILNIGEDTVLIADLLPLLGIDKSVRWESSDSTIVDFYATPSGSTDTIYRIIALEAGSVNIIATSIQSIEDAAGDESLLMTDTCKIRVYGIRTDGLSLSHDTIKINRTTILDSVLIATFSPYNTTEKDVEWTIFGDPIVNISTPAVNDTICNIVALWSGETKIVAKSLENPDYTDTCVIQVFVPVDSIVFKVDDISLSNDTVKVGLTDVKTLKATVYPDSATIKPVTWSVSNLSAIDTTFILRDTVCDITALALGESKIIASVNDRGLIYRDTCIFVVDYQPITSVSLNMPDTVILAKFEEKELSVTVSPFRLTNDSIIWTSSDSTIVNILSTVSTRYDTICQIKALAIGEAKIYATSKTNPIRRDSCVFKVEYMPITSLSLDMPDTVDLAKYEEVFLSVSVLPYRLTNDSIIWISSDSTIVDILSTVSTRYDTICHIKALAIGEAKIYATSKFDSYFRDSCVFRVDKIDMDSVSLPIDSMLLYLTNKFNLTATVLPWNATDKAVAWRSSNPAIVEIVSTGTDTICEILGKGTGEAKIYAEVVTPDGIIRDSCVITVKQQLVYLETDTVNVNGGIALALYIPANSSLTGSFELQFPKGFGLTKGEVSPFRTALVGSFKETLDLSITRMNDSTYIFDILPKTTPPSNTSPATGTKTKIMDIVYTIYDNTLLDSEESYTAKIVDLKFELNNSTEIEEDSVIILIKSFADPTGNETISAPDNIIAYINDNRLYVTTDKVETISVYSLNGSLLFTGNKKEGQAVFNIQTPEQILIVTGSSGWANKVFNR